MGCHRKPAMPKSQRLSLEDVQAVWHLLGECRELGADNQAWPQHFIEGMCRLLRSQIGVCHETVLAPNGFLETLGWADTGWATAADREFLLRMIRNQGQREPVFRRLVGVVLEKETCNREEVVPDREFYPSVLYQDYFRPLRLDPIVNCGKFTPGGTFHFGCFQRAFGDRPFGDREKALLRLAHGELVPLIGTALASVREPRQADLAPRQRQTLACLLEGDGEKQVAARLGIGIATVHTYVKALYRHFRVAGRAELLAWFVRRAYPRGVLPGAVPPPDAAGPPRRDGSSAQPASEPHDVSPFGNRSAIE
jgi:DNA-binding CsgD family transcriptional regulator